MPSIHVHVHVHGLRLFNPGLAQIGLAGPSHMCVNRHYKEKKEPRLKCPGPYTNITA